MDALLLQQLLALVVGGIVGSSVALFGGGGSILAVPLLVYLVGVPSPHVAIGTSAAAVAVNAIVSFAHPRRLAKVKWRCALVFGAAGMVGALGGSLAGKTIDGHRLLLLFALLMIVVAGLMLRRRDIAGNAAVRLAPENFGKLVGFGFGAGALSGFFGIGGGFLIVPGLMASTGMPIVNAVASSLLDVTAFSLTTAASYQLTGGVDWPIALLVAGGGLVGGAVATPLAIRLAARPGMLNAVFAGVIVLVAAYMIAESIGLA